jgi:hypothetical protein
MKNVIYLIAIITASFKKVDNYVYFSPSAITSYLTKYSVPQETLAKCEIKAKFQQGDKQGNATITISAYDDLIDYEKINEITNCKDRDKYSLKTEKLKLVGNDVWSVLAEIRFFPKNKDSAYFIDISDCDKETIGKGYPTIFAQVHCYLLDGNEFSFEERGTLIWNLGLMIIMIALLAYNIKAIISESKKDHEYVLALLFTIVIGIYLLSLACKCIHLLKYSSDGYGIAFFDVLSIVFEMAAQLWTVLLLISIAWGWMFLYKKTGDLELYIPLFALALMAHIMTGALTYVNHDDYYKFHNYQGVQGIILVVIRIGLYVVFLVGYRDTYNKTKKPQHQTFLKKYFVFSTVYILGFPILVIGSSLWSTFYRQKFVEIGNIVVQTIALYFCENLFLTKGEFYTYSQMSKSELPN